MQKPTDVRVVVLAFAAAALTLAGVAVASCGSDAPREASRSLAEANPDAGLGSPFDRTLVPVPQHPAGELDAAQPADATDPWRPWDGWTHMGNLPDVCPIFVPDSIESRVLSVEWTSCGEGCQTLRLPSRGQDGTGNDLAPLVVGLDVSRDAQGQARLMRLSRILDRAEMEFEDALYDMRPATPQPVAAFRAHTLDRCHVEVSLAGAELVLAAMFESPWSLQIAHGDPTELLRNAHFQTIAGDNLVGGQTVAASTSTLAYDDQPAGKIVRVDLGTGRAATAYGPGAALLLDHVEGNNVFARSNNGRAGWAEYYRIDADGQARVFLSKPETHVTSLDCDGARLFWIEGSGATWDVYAQPHAELWSAPYGPDSTALRSQARSIADLSGTRGLRAHAAFRGYYALASQEHEITVVRASDGVVQRLTTPSNVVMFGVSMISESEVRIVTGMPTRPRATGVMRLSLGSWP